MADLHVQGGMFDSAPASCRRRLPCAILPLHMHGYDMLFEHSLLSNSSQFESLHGVFNLNIDVQSVMMCSPSRVPFLVYGCFIMRWKMRNG